MKTDYQNPLSVFHIGEKGQWILIVRFRFPPEGRKGIEGPAPFQSLRSLFLSKIFFWLLTGTDMSLFIVKSYKSMINWMAIQDFSIEEFLK
jgi:hypothetical protein